MKRFILTCFCLATLLPMLNAKEHKAPKAEKWDSDTPVKTSKHKYNKKLAAQITTQVVGAVGNVVIDEVKKNRTHQN